MENIILTGYGWTEYAVAAAAALRKLGDKAEVIGASRSRLPEKLETLPGDVRNVFILGVSLGGDEERLAAALKSLRRRKVSVKWISAVDAGESQKRDLLPLMESIVEAGGSLLDVVGSAFGVDVAQLRLYVAAGSRVPADVRDYHELFEAAQFFHRYYEDEKAYGKSIKYLANDVNPDGWDDDTHRMVAHYNRYKGRELLGKSPAMCELREKIKRVAMHENARVLIIGESGTGKEAVAQQIHNKSPRAAEKDENFKSFNCASVSPHLLEDRFFGHEKGAFSGADQRKDGLFTVANGGTLFLDEIGELPLEAQGLLLRVLEVGKFTRLGGHEEIPTNVRLITATNRNLPARVREGKFRADLFQRLNVVQIRIPPLRERMEDVREIADGWWFNNHRKHLSDEQIAALMEYDYPGNVRELLNLLDRATVLDETDFAKLIAEHKEMNAGLTDDGVSADGACPDDLESAIRRHVRHVFDKYGQNIVRTAQALRISRNTAKKYL